MAGSYYRVSLFYKKVMNARSTIIRYNKGSDNEGGEEMELKLTNSPIWTKSAIKWFVFSSILFWASGVRGSFLYFLSGVLAATQSIYLLTRVTELTYLSLTDEALMIHLRRFRLRKRKIHYGDISKAELIHKDYILYLNNGRQVKIRRDWISFDDYTLLKEVFKAHSISAR